MHYAITRDGRALSTLLSAIIVTVSGCTGLPTEHAPTKAIIQNIYGWTSYGLNGQFDSPQLPVKVAATFEQKSFAGAITANTIPNYPYPFSNLRTKFFGAAGPGPFGDFLDWNHALVEYSTNWATDPAFPNKDVSRPSGNYPVGTDGFTVKRDMAYAWVNMATSASTTAPALGQAHLPWIYNTEQSSMVGSATVINQGEALWVQATAQLPLPISHAWTLNGAAQSWTGSLVYTSLTKGGNNFIKATMTGANGAQVQRTWTVNVQCPPSMMGLVSVCVE